LDKLATFSSTPRPGIITRRLVLRHGLYEEISKDRKAIKETKAIKEIKAILALKVTKATRETQALRRISMPPRRRGGSVRRIRVSLLVVPRVTRGIKAILDQRAIREILVSKVLKVQKEIKEIKATRVILEKSGSLVVQPPLEL